MSAIFLIFCVCFNCFVCGSDDANTLCKTTELLKQINDLKSFVIVDSKSVKQIQINILKDLQNQKEIIDSNQQSLKADLQDLQEENKVLKGVLQDMNKLFRNATQSLKGELQDLLQENKALKGVLQDMNRVSENETQSLKEDVLDVLEEIKSLRNITQSQVELTQQKQQTMPRDCSDILAGGQSTSGTYKIFPSRNQRNKSLEVFCDMEDGGGWTVFLLRNAAAEHINFTRNWDDYKEFFGSADQEYWIGNENLHALTSNRSYEVRFEAKDGEGRSTWQGWNSFSVASEENSYQLTLEGYDQRSTVREDKGFGFNRGFKFSTFENNNDEWGVLNCAKDNKGGWWYSDCSLIFPTGIHGKEYPEGVMMISWSKEDRIKRYPRWLQFKIRPTN